ncbi:hypothetical protein KCU90_g3314, partial [Aureobasidium melanogenum]
MLAVANQNQGIAERPARQRGRQHVVNRSGIRAPLAVEQQRMCREAPREIQVMARKQHCTPWLARPGAQRFQTVDLVVQIQMRERFVEQQQRCLLAQHGCQRDTLPFATREREHVARSKCGEAQAVERGMRGSTIGLAFPPPAAQMRKTVQHHDVEHARAERIGCTLRHQRATLRERQRPPVGETHAVEFDMAGRRLRQTGERGEQSCLARAVGPGNAPDLAGVERVRERVEQGTHARAQGQALRAERHVGEVVRIHHRRLRSSIQRNTGTPTIDVITPTGNCAGAITRRGRQQHALIVAEREPQHMRYDKADKADGARRRYRGGSRERRHQIDTQAQRHHGDTECLRSGVPPQQYIQPWRRGDDRHQHDGQRNKRHPRHRTAVQIAGQPEQHPTQPVVRREIEQQGNDGAPTRRDHRAGQQQTRRRILRLAPPQLAARETEHQQDRHEGAGERAGIDDPPRAAGDHRDQRECGGPARHAQYPGLGQGVAQQHLQQRTGQRQQRAAREAGQRARQTQRAHDLAGKIGGLDTRHMRRQQRRQHARGCKRHTAERERRHQHSQRNSREREPDRGRAFRIHHADRVSGTSGTAATQSQRHNEARLALENQLAQTRAEAEATRTELALMREERDALQAERDALSAKIDDAQVRLNAILEKLPRARAHSEPDNQLDLLDTAPQELEAESDVTRHGENA